MANPSVESYCINAIGTTPVATRAASKDAVHYIAGIIAVVNTASIALTVNSTADGGEATPVVLYSATLGIGTHIMGFPSTVDTPGLPALAKNADLAADLAIGAAGQILTMYGSTRPNEILTS